MTDTSNGPDLEELLSSLSHPPPEVSTEEAEAAALDAFGLKGRAEALGGERDRNFLLHTDGSGLLLKFANASEPDTLLEFQCRALEHIARRNPALPVQWLTKTPEGRDWAVIAMSRDTTLRLRVFEFMRGEPLGQASYDARLMRNVGAMAADLGRALRGFHHPAADHPLAWDLKRFELLSGLLPHVPDDGPRDAVVETLGRFTETVGPELGGLRAQVIHNDLSYHNTLVDPGAPTGISGIFDFGDLVYAPLVQDLAVTASEVPACHADPLSRSAEIISGYAGRTPLEDVEYRLLPDLIAARLAQGLLIDYWSGESLDWQDDREHFSNWRVNAVAMLEQIVAAGAAEFESMIRAACGKGPVQVPGLRHRQPSDRLMRRRLACLGNGSYVSYERPLQAVRGEGVWLYDETGRAYLDAYNNVPHVGHCHPRVVAAVARQTAALNTNTRYLYDSIVAYAERITGTLPDGLDVCYFVSSGSEANDLAWQLAGVWTGNDGGLIMENAYHGVTDAVFRLSPSGLNSPQPDPGIATLPPPDDFRGEWRRDVAERGRLFAARCDDAIETLRSGGHEPSALFVDMIMSSNGIIVPPPGYLEGVFSRVRSAGGLCVADEVQSGFGRLGKVMWGFETGEVVPDIVTFGKPIANGYPMGLVVTTRAIADRFGEYAEYFSTTGGNPVACASALAVLDVLEEEGLMHNAERIGDRIMGGLLELSGRHELIGDVRGSGLFIGVELVEDRESLQPATEKTRSVVDHLREQGVLVGIDGPYDNVVKIRPPMVFNGDHADRLLQTLDNALAAIVR